MGDAVRMSNLISLSYVVFAISGLCFSNRLFIRFYSSHNKFFLYAFSVSVVICSVFISELILTLHWLCCSISFV
jgi:hypothetical protein